MARKASPKTSTAESAPNAPNALGASNDGSEHEIIEVASSEETWSIYTLADGTVVRVKPVMAEFIRVVGKFTEEGEPIYLMKGGLVPSLRVPKRLMRKP